jgi:hypothetical protein
LQIIGTSLMVRGMGSDAAANLDVDVVRSALYHQFAAALSMLREAIRTCPDDLWKEPSDGGSCQDIAVRAVFFTRFFLHQNLASYRPWNAATDTSRPTADDALPPTDEEPETRTEAVAYVERLMAEMWERLDTLDLTKSKRGFPGAQMTTLEHVIMTLRQLQHLTTLLAGRVQRVVDEPITWIARDGAASLN